MKSMRSPARSCPHRTIGEGGSTLVLRAAFAIAAMGMAAGAGFYGVSGVAAFMILLTLVLLVYIENLFNLKPRYMLFRVSSNQAQDLVPEVHGIFSKLGIDLDNFQVSMTGEKHLIQFDAEVSHRQQESIGRTLRRARYPSGSSGGGPFRRTARLRR